jgi:hypothetical protein
MHARTYALESIIRLSRSFVCIKVDPGTGGRAQKVCDKWRIGVERRGERFDYPIAILLDLEGKIVSTHMGFFEADVFAGFLEGALEKAGGKRPEDKGGKSPGKGGVIRWETSYEDALDTAEFEEKPILLAFLEKKGKASVRLLRESLADPAVTGLAEKFVCIRIDPGADEDSAFIADSFRQDAEKLGAAFRYPLLLVLSSELDVLAASSGFVPPAAVVEMMKKARSE